MRTSGACSPLGRLWIHRSRLGALGLLTLLACDSSPPPARTPLALPDSSGGAGGPAALLLGRVEGVPPVRATVVRADPVGASSSFTQPDAMTTAVAADGTWQLAVPRAGRYRIALTEPGAVFSPSETTLVLGRGDTVRLRWRRAQPTEGLPPDVADSLDAVRDTWPTAPTVGPRTTSPSLPPRVPPPTR